MANMVVPYARFLEVRQRRRCVTAELTQPAVTPADGDSLQVQPAPADKGVGGDDARRLMRTTNGAESAPTSPSPVIVTR